nr:hypothetical protein REQ54_01100 [Rhizobium sp. Q54]
METTLSGFLAAYDRKPWEPSTVNCLMFTAAWAIWLGYSDPVEKWRGTFHTEDQFKAIVEAAGGCAPLMDEAAATIGAKRVDRPSRGDVGVIGSVRNIHRQFGAICDGDRWLVRFINSIGPMTARPLTVWRL